MIMFCVCVRICVPVCTHEYIYICVHMYIDMRETYLCVLWRVCECMCMCVHINICIYVRMYVGTRVAHIAIFLMGTAALYRVCSTGLR